MTYDLSEHRHRFSIWAAARAAQRGFTNIDNLRDALEQTDIRAFLETHAIAPITAEQFALRQADWCAAIMDDLVQKGVQNVTFGRAAKLVAVYIKSMIIIGPYGNTELARVAHPPIDRLILQNLSRLDSVPSDTRVVFRETNWTRLDREEYSRLIALIRQHVLEGSGAFWHLEQHWNVTQDDDL